MPFKYNVYTSKLDFYEDTTLPSVPEVQVFFSTNLPTDVGVVFTPDTPALENTLYISETTSQVYTYSDGIYSTYVSPIPNNTPFYIYGTSLDAGGNKTAVLSRNGAVAATSFTTKKTLTSTGATNHNKWWKVFDYNIYANYIGDSFKLQMNEYNTSSGSGKSVIFNIIVKRQDPNVYVTVDIESGATAFDLTNFDVLYNSTTKRISFFYKLTTTYTYTSWLVLNSRASTTSEIVWQNDLIGTTLSGQTSDALAGKAVSLNKVNGAYTLPTIAPSIDQVLGYSAPGISAWITGSGSLAGNVLFVSSAGSDTDVTRAGHLGDAKKPFLTLQAARNAAISGDLIYVFPQTFIFNNTGGAYNSNLADLNMWKDGITYYWSPGTKVQISNVISSTLNTIYFFRPSGLAFETCTSIGHLEYTQTTTGGSPAFGAIFYFYDYNITSGYTFYSQTKSQIGYSNEIINVQRDLVSSANISTVTIISDYEKVIHSPQMEGTGAGNYVSGGDNTLIFNSYVRERYYGTLFAFGCRYNFTKSTVNFFGETMYVTYGSGEFSTKIMDLRYAYGTINVDIKKTTLFESSSNTNASGIYARSANDGAVGGITLNYKGDITETSTTGSAFALFRIDSASNTINYNGNITMSPSNAGRVVVSVSNNSKVNITGNIIYNGVSPSTSTIFATSGTAQLKYIGNISGNFANNIAQCGTGTVEINNSNIKSTVAGAGSYFFLNGGTSLGTVKINNSYIELNNSTNPSANGAYVKALINNSTLISSGASAGIANSTNFGSLQAVNSMIYATSLPVNYTGTAAVTVASASTNTAWTVATPILGGTLDIIPSLTF